MRTVGLLLAVGGTAAGLTDLVAMYTFVRIKTADWQQTHGTLMFTADWPWTMIITGVVAVAVAAAFTEGARLQQESDGVV